MLDANSIKNVAWGASFEPHLAYLPRIPVNPCTAARRVRGDFLTPRRLKNLTTPSNRRNHVVNPWVHFREDDRERPVTQ